jgi:hypothetical protein
LYVIAVAASSTPVTVARLRYSTESVNVVLPDLVLDSTRYTRSRRPAR